MLRKLSCALFAVILIAKNSSAITVSVDGQQFALDYANNHMVAKNKKQSIEAKLIAEDGNFSQWLFQQKNVGVIFNKHTKKIVSLNNDANDSGGPVLISANEGYVLLDYGTGPDPRGLSLVDGDGRVLLDKVSYWSKYPVGFKISNKHLYLFYIGSSRVENDGDVEKCLSTTGGHPEKLETIRINMTDLEDKVVARNLSDIVCTQ